ncbi:MAG: ABC transporter ATP-binding protein [Bacilli bacterium]|nr:ABC transporter ATP-binding protein [Bacilli bacterium]
MFKILKKINKKEISLMLVVVLLVVFQVWLDLKSPEYMAEITKLVQTPGSKIIDILLNGFFMILCALGSLAGAIAVGYLVSYVSSTFAFRLRKLLFSKVGDFSMEEIKAFSTNSLITRTTNDLTQVQIFLAVGLQILIKSPLLAIWAIFKVLNKSWEWMLLTAGSVFFILIYIIILVLFVMPKFKKVQEAIDDVNGIARENLLGIRVVRAFNAEDYQENKFTNINNNLTSIQTFIQKMMSTMQPVMHLVMQMLTVGIYLIGAYLISSAGSADKLNIFSNMVVFSTYAMMILMAFVSLASVFIFYPRASVSALRINEVLETESKIKDGYVNRDTSKVKGTVEFKDVSFKYPDADEYMLQNISFKVNEGETFAIIGSTGSGKSTLINLLPRLYDATKGTVLVNDIDVKKYKQSFLNNKISYIPQKAGMFSGTVKENVNYGTSNVKKTQDRLKKAIEIAQAKDFVENLDGQYDSYIARGGTNVSGGQKQRLSIARAIMKKPEIYIFDDTFSALDYKTDLKLRQELKKHTKEASCIIVSQRIGTILNANQILVLDKGKSVGLGTHQELLKTCRVYKEIALTQLSEKELKE